MKAPKTKMKRKEGQFDQKAPLARTYKSVSELADVLRSERRSPLGTIGLNPNKMYQSLTKHKLSFKIQIFKSGV